MTSDPGKNPEHSPPSGGHPDAPTSIIPSRSGVFSMSTAAGLGEQSGERIGNYQLLRVLGEGGFGVVWLAMQREPIVREVALKILKPGMDSRQVLARFEQERQALALMDHPCVAKVFDAGATAGGRPYFVMEYVSGEAITGFCDQARMAVRARLELFIRVCDAIQHAHTKGIIHRDIKPSNILVETTDAGPVPKVIDFGVAKAVEHTLTEKTIFTEFGQIVGTPEYMSPEQAQADAKHVDTRTDVYSLGVVLYELLSGALPFDPQTLRSAGYAEVQRIIREVEPPRPSTRLSGLGRSAAHVADVRGSRAEELAGELRRELEWVPLKAMRKEQAERYQTPADLAADIRNYLEKRPLVAGPESAVYRARKFVRRNRIPVAFAAMLALAGMGAVASVAYGYVQARRGERETALALKRSSRANWFLTDMIGAADPNSRRPVEWGGQAGAMLSTDEVTVRQMVDMASERLKDGEFADDPNVEATLRRSIGSAYSQLGYAKDAEVHLRRALEIERGSGETAGRPGRIAAVLSDLGGLYVVQQRTSEARGALEEALGLMQGVAGASRLEVAEVTSRLARVEDLEQKPDRAMELYADALATYEGERGDAKSSNKAATILSAMGVVQRRAGKANEALALHERALERVRQVEPEGSARYANILALKADALRELGRLDDAEEALRASVVAWRQVTPSGSLGMAAAQATLGRLLMARSKVDEAEPLFRESLAFRKRAMGGRSVQVAESLDDLGQLLRRRGMLDEAIGAYREGLSIREERVGANSVENAALMVALADTLNQAGRAAEALPHAQKAYELRSGVLAKGHWTIASARGVLGAVLTNLGKFEEAEPHLLNAYSAFKVSTAGDPRRLRDALVRLEALYKAWGKDGRAGEYREELEKISGQFKP